MQITTRLTVICLVFATSLGGMTQKVCARRAGGAGQAQAEPSRLTRKQIWDSFQEVKHGVYIGFRMLRKPNKYGLSAEDRFLLGFFKAMVIEKMFDAASVRQRMRARDLEGLKKGAMREFAMQLSKLPRKPFWLETLGWMPSLFSGLSLVVSVLAYTGLAWKAPNPKTFLMVSVLTLCLCIAQCIAKILRLGRRFAQVYQRFVEDMMAQQQSMASRGNSMMPMG